MAHITGNSTNVQINAADLVLTDVTKKLIAPKAELSSISGVSLLTTGRVGVSNTSPIHTLDIGANVFVDDTATGSDPVLNVIGRLKATTIDFHTGGTDGGLFFNDGGALNTDTDGLSFNKTTDVLTVEGGIITNGAIDANSTADIADTLTLSKGSGVALEVSTGGVTNLKALTANNTNIIGTLDVTSATTLNTLETSGVSLLKDVHSNAMNVVGTLDASGATALSDNLTVRVSKLVVDGTGVTTDGTLNVQTGKLAVDSSVTTSVDLNVRSGKLLANDTGISTSGILDVAGVSRLGTVFANATTITDGLTVSDGGLTVTAGGATVSAGGLTVSSGTTALQAMTATSTTVSGTTIINGSGNALQVSNNAIISGSLQVNGNLNVEGELTVLTTNNLVIQDPIIELGNVHAQGLGVSYDTGMVFTQPSGSNVATWYDITDSGTYRIAKTNNNAHNTTLEPVDSIEVEVTGNLTSTGNVNASDALVTGDLSMGSGNIRISGNTIYFT